MDKIIDLHGLKSKSYIVLSTDLKELLFTYWNLLKSISKENLINYLSLTYEIIETLNLEDEIKNALSEPDSTKINLYKINFSKGVKAVALSNCIYYDNQNKTLPIGMDQDTRLVVNMSDTDIQLNDKRTIRIGMLEDEKDESSKLIIKTINVLEYAIKDIEE